MGVGTGIQLITCTFLILILALSMDFHDKAWLYSGWYCDSLRPYIYDWWLYGYTTLFPNEWEDVGTVCSFNNNPIPSSCYFSVFMGEFSGILIWINKCNASWSIDNYFCTLLFCLCTLNIIWWHR